MNTPSNPALGTKVKKVAVNTPSAKVDDDPNPDKPFLLDLFAGAGGCAMGYHLAGFAKDRIVGVDIHWFRHYPFKLVQGDVFKLLPELLQRYPITHIHASPPCQAYSTATAPYLEPTYNKPGGKRPELPTEESLATPQLFYDSTLPNSKSYTYPDYIPRLRQELESTGLPYVIENVEYSPLIETRRVLLCGCMPVFQGNQQQLGPERAASHGSTILHDPVPMTRSGGLRVIRHRLFESNVQLTAPASPCTPKNPDGTLPHKPNYPKYHAFNGHPLVYTTKKAYAHYGQRDPWQDFVLVYGGGNAPAEACRDAMGIDWMNRDELCEAIPPAYTQFIGRQLLQAKGFAAPLPEQQLAMF